MASPQTITGLTLLKLGNLSYATLVVKDANGNLATGTTPMYQTPSGILVPGPADANGYPYGKTVGSNRVLTTGSVSFAANAASGTTDTFSVALPNPLQKDALYLVSVMNPTGTPQGLTATVGTSGTVGSNLTASTTYYYAVSAVGPWGETLISATVSATEGTTAYPISLAWTAQGGATSYNVYKGTTTSVDLLASAGNSTSYTDSGNTATSSTAPPTTSTQGPGTSVTIAFQNAQTFGTSTTYYANVTSVDLADGIIQSYLVQGWLMGSGASQIQISLDNAASDQDGDVWIEVTMV